MSAKNKTAEQLATKHADERFPNASKYNAPFCTLAERWDDSHDDFLAGYIEATRWIPVEEELPEERLIDPRAWSRTVKVLVKTRNEKVAICERYWNKYCNEWEWRGSGTFRDSIIAWRPIE